MGVKVFLPGQHSSERTQLPLKSVQYRIAYYLAVLIPIILLGVVGIWRVTWETSFDYPPQLIVALVLSQLGLPGNIFWTLVTLHGFFRSGAPSDRTPGPDWRWDPDTLLILAYVSRGDQPEAVRRSVETSRGVLTALDVRHTIEVVTDIEIPRALRIPGDDILYEVVPREYETPEQARYKARALQYLLERRTARLQGDDDVGNIWVLHLDEESTITPECMVGILEFTQRYDVRTTPGAIGQGEILYNAGRYGHAPLIDAIDAVRTGDDLGRFRMQFVSLHKPVFGMHGSFVLVPARIERQITWDVGGLGSITEDTYFALSAMERGIHFDWVEGFIREQSPFTVGDLLQQRRRWFCGLSHIVRDKRLKLWTRLRLRLVLLAWSVGSASLIFGILTSILFGSKAFPPWLVTVLAMSGGVWVSIYVLGAVRNAIHSNLSWPRRLLNVLLAAGVLVVLLPPLIEAVAVAVALARPMKAFYVVRKEMA